MLKRYANAKRLKHNLFYPDYTVGPGVTPDLLTSSNSLELRKRSRAIPPVGTYTPP